MSSDEELHDQEPASPRPEDEEVDIDEAVDDETLRIMVSTDNHLGYAEKDPIRGMDSFAAFEEVLYLAKRHKVRAAGAIFGAQLFCWIRVCVSPIIRPRLSGHSDPICLEMRQSQMVELPPVAKRWGRERGPNCSWPSDRHRTLSFFKISFVDLYCFLCTRPTDMVPIFNSPSKLDTCTRTSLYMLLLPDFIHNCLYV